MRKDIKFVPIFLDFLDRTEMLEEDAIGRLVIAMVTYGNLYAAQIDDETIAIEIDEILKGPEKYLWPSIKKDLTRSFEKAQEKGDAHRKALEEANKKNPKKTAFLQKESISIANALQMQSKSVANDCKEEEEEEEKEEEKEEEQEEEEEELLSGAAVADVNITSYAVSKLKDKDKWTKEKLEQLKEYEKILPKQVIMHAIDIAAASGRDKSYFSYARGIMDNWIDRDLTTTKAVMQSEKDYETWKRKQNKNNPATDYEQRDYSDDELEKYYMDLS